MRKVLKKYRGNSSLLRANMISRRALTGVKAWVLWEVVRGSLKERKGG